MLSTKNDTLHGVSLDYFNQFTPHPFLRLIVRFLYLPVTHRPLMPLNPLLQGDHINQWISTAEQYYYPWDIPGEIIQGSIRELIDLDDEHRELFPSHIHIIIDPQNKSILVKDNGRGFQEFSELGMHRSGHGGEVTRSGFGIGLSAVLARSDYFEINTRINSDEGIEQVAIGFDNYWTKLKMSRKRMQLSKEVDFTAFNEEKIDTPNAFENLGSIIYATGDEGFEQFWDGIHHLGPEKFIDALLCHTALGFTGDLFGEDTIPPISYIIEIKSHDGACLTCLDSDNQDECEICNGTRLVTNEDIHREGERIGFLQNSPDNQLEFQVHPPTERNDGEPSRNHFMKYITRGRAGVNDSSPVIDVFALCAVGAERGSDDISGEQKLKDNFPDFITDDHPTSRIFLSIDGFLQPFRIAEPATRSNLNVNNWYFAVVNVDRNIVEQGRNAITDTYSRYIAAKVRDMLSHLDGEYRALSRGVDNEEVRADIDGAIEHITNNPLPAIVIQEDENGSEEEIIPPQIYEPTFLGIPQRESEVVALFVDLCAHGIIEDTRLMTAGDNVTLYDMLLRYDFELSRTGISFRRWIRRQAERNDEAHYSEDSPVSQYLPAMQAEFKFHATDLATELNRARSRKNIDQINLLVAWDAGNAIRGWEIRPITEHEKIHPQANWILEKTTERARKTEVILLENLFGF